MINGSENIDFTNKVTADQTEKIFFNSLFCTNVYLEPRLVLNRYLQFFYFILFQIEVLVKLLDKIRYLFHQIMILLCLFIPAACMFYITLPMLLSVKSLIFYFPTISSSLYDFSRIFPCNLYACNPCKLCCFLFSICLHFLFCIVDQIYILILKRNLILIFDPFI